MGPGTKNYDDLLIFFWLCYVLLCQLLVNKYLHVRPTCAGETITGVTSQTGAIIAVDDVMTSGHTTAATVVACTLIDLCANL